jgi:predicted anti-sigma-YlaC factor YlaD
MKITKRQLKQIIKEELSSLFEGNYEEEYCAKHPKDKDCEDYHAKMKKDEQDYQNQGVSEPALNEDLTHAIEVLQDPEKQKILAQAFAQIGLNLSPAVLGTIAIMAIRKALGYDKEDGEG